MESTNKCPCCSHHYDKNNLQDVPMIRTYINAYTAIRTTIPLAIEKLMDKSEFKGISPVDAFCSLLNTLL